ncbi:MAG: amidohydrolase family protein [Planctomycetaceae bacterium]
MTTLEARRWDNGQAVRIRMLNGKIVSILASESSDADLPFVGPGLYDIQLNGYRGIWFSSETLTEDHVEQVIVDFAQNGITRCLPTLITNSFDAIAHGLHTIQNACRRSAIVRHVVAGCHIEGPYISPENGPRGAHPLQHVRAPSISELMKWQQISGGQVRLMTMAPEWHGSADFIRSAVGSGIVIAIGHTAATSEVILQSIDAGATLGTHLGNGCAAMIPRHDNTFWPQLADDRLTCSVIADGWHVPATMLKCVARCKPQDRIVLTCDVSGFGGCSPGRYSSGTVDVDVLSDGRIVVAGQTQFLAGSGALTGECVLRFAAASGLSLCESWALASTTPARIVGDTASELKEGAIARLTVFRTKPDRKGGCAAFVPVESIIGTERFCHSS